MQGQRQKYNRKESDRDHASPEGIMTGISEAVDTTWEHVCLKVQHDNGHNARFRFRPMTGS